jgi:cysteine desulfuration protein SufE
MSHQATIRDRAREIVEEFALFDDWMGKYEYLIDLGKLVPPIEVEYKTDDYKIKGCQSQVWIRPEMRSGLLYYKGDSDAVITKGLVALLIRVLNGQPPAAVVEADLSFLDEIGMKEHLSPTRKNGLASMMKQLKLYALAHAHAAQN